MSFITETGGYKPTDGRVYAIERLLNTNSHSPIPGDTSNSYVSRMLSAALSPASPRERANYSLDTLAQTRVEQYKPKVLTKDTYLQ